MFTDKSNGTFSRMPVIEDLRDLENFARYARRGQLFEFKYAPIVGRFISYIEIENPDYYGERDGAIGILDYKTQCHKRTTDIIFYDDLEIDDYAYELEDENDQLPVLTERDKFIERALQLGSMIAYGSNWEMIKQYRIQMYTIIKVAEFKGVKDAKCIGSHILLNALITRLESSLTAL